MKSGFKPIILMSIFSQFLNFPAYALKIGVTAGPHATILKEVEKELTKKGVLLEIIEFNDFILPNEALQSGDLDANSHQHLPFLEDQIKSRNYKVVSIAKTIILPLGIYSKSIQNIADLKDQAKIAIPNDPTNGGRSLLLLQKAGLIELRNAVNPSVLDIEKNPKRLRIIEVEAPQIPRILRDVDLAVINTDWVLVSGLDPNSAIFRESKDSPYANIIAVRKGDESRSDIQALKSAYQSNGIRKFIHEQFKGAVLPAW